jgi:hypothetical protein
MGNSHENVLVWNHLLNKNKIWHIFGREPSNDYFIQILFLLSKWFQTRTFSWEFPIGSYVKLSSLWTLNFCLFWPIMQIRKKGGWNLKKKFSSETTEPISTNFAEMILGWSPSKIVSGISDLRPRWPPQRT